MDPDSKIDPHLVSVRHWRSLDQIEGEGSCEPTLRGGSWFEDRPIFGDSPSTGGAWIRLWKRVAASLHCEVAPGSTSDHIRGFVEHWRSLDQIVEEVAASLH